MSDKKELFEKEEKDNGVIGVITVADETSEENQTKELNEDELNMVTGGYSGDVPEGGIVFSTYDKPQVGYFYAIKKTILRDQYLDVVRLDEIFPEGYPDDDLKDLPVYRYYKQDFRVNNGVWYSEDKEYGEHRAGFFHMIYPYRLSVAPR